MAPSGGAPYALRYLTDAKTTRLNAKIVKIAVASQNPVKLNAARTAFERMFPGTTIDSVAIAVPSGVSDQPFSDAETRRGARSRARNALGAVAGADYGVGVEGGVDDFDDTLMAFAWMAVSNSTGVFGEARTVTLPLPPQVRTLVKEGMELGDANDRVFSTVNSKQQGGAFGLLTNGICTRESVYTEALIVALVPFVSELFVPGAATR